MFHSNLLSAVVVRNISFWNVRTQQITITLRVITPSYIQHDLGFSNQLEIAHVALPEPMVLIEQLPSERTELQQKHLNIKWLKYINFGQKDVLAEFGLVGGCTNQNHTTFKLQKGILKWMKRIKN